ncbi:MAG TPA: hypothetical protein VEI50_10030 [Nitrospiraceae bacterium]|nr:hypothetical protein [Nitrospiraceae bacterium]
MDTNRILVELRAERDRIERVIAALEGVNSPGRLARYLRRASRKTRRISAAGRARIAAAQRARWARFKQAKASKPKRNLSRAARNKIAAGQRLRWAKARVQQQAQKKAA